MSGALGQQMMLSRLLMVIAQSRHHPLGPWQRQCRLSGRAGGGQERVEGLPKHAGRGSNARQRQVAAPHTENHHIENLDKSVERPVQKALRTPSPGAASWASIAARGVPGRSWLFGTAQPPLPTNGSPPASTSRSAENTPGESGDVRRHKEQRTFGA
ncbi:hypothetical protein E4U38_005540 [Claviceps purpurea]|nr:hypothetical protein E4U38_005540 [Claviceps purpurea]